MRQLLRFGTIFLLLQSVTPPALAACVGMRLSLNGSEDSTRDTCASDSAKAPEGKGTAYHVGPGQRFGRIGDVPWHALAGGDTVFIHHRPEPYREKIIITGSGTPEAWIRVIGIPGPDGSLPVISGQDAETSRNMRYRWKDPSLIEALGVIQIAVGPERADSTRTSTPAYIEIANLQVQDGFSTSRFRASNGALLAFSGFAACIYARSVNHLIVRNSVLTNCGQGFYNWTGDGTTPGWWTAVQSATVLSGNHFFNNGTPESYLTHQIYSESDGLIIEYNRLGPMRAGALGSQIKDRSIGTVIRYNAIDTSPRGWALDLVEPEESWPAFGGKPQFKQTFVYGNAIVSKSIARPNLVHWNEDHQGGRGRATIDGGRLFFYQNTIAILSDGARTKPLAIFNATWGGYDCPPSPIPGIIDVRNNIIASLPLAGGKEGVPMRLGYCGKEKIALGANWLSPGVVRDDNVQGWPAIVPTAANDPGFMSDGDFRLQPHSAAATAGAALAPEVANNSLGLDLTPLYRFAGKDRLAPRKATGAGSGLGAF